MTNFQLITQNATTLDDFISAVVDDALEAKGCSMELKLPYELQEGAGGVFLSRTRNKKSGRGFDTLAHFLFASGGYALFLK